VGKLISVSFVFSNNIWVVCSQLLSVKGILFCNGSQNAFGEPWFVQGALFFSRRIAIWTGAEPDIFIWGGHWRGQFCNKGSCQWSV